MSLRIGSLFTGTGGLDMTVQEVLGGELAFVADIAPGACKLLAHRFPDVLNLGDITAVDWSDWIGRVDVLTGGYPCQPFSMAGARKGADDDRHMWPHVVDALAVVRPPLAVFENVRGHLSLGFDEVLADLHMLGYEARWVTLAVSDIGGCHRRQRLFILAVRRDQPPAVPEFPLAVARRGKWWEPNPGLFGPHRFDGALPQAGRMIAGALDALPQAGVLGGGLMLPSAVVQLLPTPAASNPNDGEDTDTWLARRERVKETAGNGNGMGMPLAIAVALLPTPSVADVEGGRKHRSGDRSDELLLNGLAHHERFGDFAPAIASHERLVGRPAPSPTEPGQRGKPRLAAKFVEFMMALPEGWVTDVPNLRRSEQLALLGNGVCPPQAVAALHRLLDTA